MNNKQKGDPKERATEKYQRILLMKNIFKNQCGSRWFAENKV